MQRRTIEIAVGIFFLLGIAAFIMLAIKVSGLSDVYVSREGYMITADFENVGGLKPRARVTIAGVPIGRVTSINFDKKDYIARVSIFIDDKINNLPEDSSATILTAGLLGDNYIGLTPGFSDKYFKNGDHIALESTNKAIILEELVSKFMSSTASGLKENN